MRTSALNGWVDRSPIHMEDATVPPCVHERLVVQGTFEWFARWRGECLQRSPSAFGR
jgi:hypothetical protein